MVGGEEGSTEEHSSLNNKPSKHSRRHRNTLYSKALVLFYLIIAGISKYGDERLSRQQLETMRKKLYFKSPPQERNMRQNIN